MVAIHCIHFRRSEYPGYPIRKFGYPGPNHPKAAREIVRIRIIPKSGALEISVISCVIYTVYSKIFFTNQHFIE